MAPKVKGVGKVAVPVTVKAPPKVVSPVPSKVRVGLVVTLPKVIAVVVADPAVMVEPLIAVVAPTLPKVRAVWFVVPNAKAPAESTVIVPEVAV